MPANFRHRFSAEKSKPQAHRNESLSPSVREAEWPVLPSYLCRRNGKGALAGSIACKPCDGKAARSRRNRSRTQDRQKLHLSKKTLITLITLLLAFAVLSKARFENLPCKARIPFCPHPAVAVWVRLGLKVAPMAWLDATLSRSPFILLL